MKTNFEKTRDEFSLVIRENALAWAVGVCDQNEIDKLNILKASIMAMHKALDALNSRPDHIIVDGNKIVRLHMKSGLPLTYRVLDYNHRH